MAKTLSFTTEYNKNMIPCIIFGEYGWNFIFVDTNNDTFVKDEDVTMDWLDENLIAPYEFSNYCWDEYRSMKDNGVECGLISYFTKDDAPVYNYAKTLDVKGSYSEALNA